MTKGFSNSNRFVTTLISTINFMTMDFDYLKYVTSPKLQKVNDKNVKPVSSVATKLRRFLSEDPSSSSSLVHFQMRKNL